MVILCLDSGSLGHMQEGSATSMEVSVQEADKVSG